MRIRLLLALIALAITVALPTLAEQKDTVDPRVAEQIRVLASIFDAAVNRNDDDVVTAFYKEHAIEKTPHGTFTGRQGF